MPFKINSNYSVKKIFCLEYLIDTECSSNVSEYYGLLRLNR